MNEHMNAHPARRMTVLALAGSFRADSVNQALLETARDLAPDDMIIESIDLRELPFYDGDVEAAGSPDGVVVLQDRVREADAILFVTPEYNGSLPGVLKNAIDWASRGYPNAPLHGKLTLAMGATPGRSGTRAAQDHLAVVLDRIGAVRCDIGPVMVARAADEIQNGRYTGDAVRRSVQAALDDLRDAIHLGRTCGSRSAMV